MWSDEINRACQLRLGRTICLLTPAAGPRHMKEWALQARMTVPLSVGLLANMLISAISLSFVSACACWPVPALRR